MSTLTLLANDVAGAVLRAAVGASVSDASGLAELVRGEVSARRECTRASTIRRVRRFVEVAGALDEEALGTVCDQLERSGDIASAPGGRLFATPLRAIEIGDGALKIVCSLPTRLLSRRLEGAWSIKGVARSVRLDKPEHASAVVGALKGVLLTPAQWACLDRAPLADDAWLAGLDRRLKARAQLAASLERDELLSWRGFIATPDGTVWSEKAEHGSTRLWRGRNRWGYWHYAWTGKGSPRDAAFVSLTADEGTRTAFALARGLGPGVGVAVRRSAVAAAFTVGHWLPAAEYRYLSVCASSSADDHSAWSIALDRLPDVLELLRARLGISVTDEAGR